MPEASTEQPEAIVVADATRFAEIGAKLQPGQFPERKADFDFLVRLLTDVGAVGTECLNAPGYAAATELLQAGFLYEEVQKFGVEGAIICRDFRSILPILLRAAGAGNTHVEAFCMRIGEAAFAEAGLMPPDEEVQSSAEPALAESDSPVHHHIDVTRRPASDTHPSAQSPE